MLYLSGCFLLNFTLVVSTALYSLVVHFTVLYQEFFFSLYNKHIRFHKLLLYFISNIFKESALWADSFYKSKCPYVCLSVCLFVRYTFSLRFTVFLPPTSRSSMSKLFRFSESFGEIMERSGFRFENFCS